MGIAIVEINRALLCIFCCIAALCIAQEFQDDEDLQDPSVEVPGYRGQKRDLHDLINENKISDFFRMSKRTRQGPLWRVVKRKNPFGRQMKGEDVSQFSRIIKRRNRNNGKFGPFNVETFSLL